MNDTLTYLNALNYTSCLGPNSIFKLIRFFNYNPRLIWTAPLKQLQKSQIKPNILEKFILERKQINPDQEWDRLQKLNINIIFHSELIKCIKSYKNEQAKNNEDKTALIYPRLLAQIPCPPPIMYLKGTLPDTNEIRVAVVGSRQVSLYGKQVIADIVYNLAQHKIVIVSGLALGADALAHQAALKAKTPTIAVLANGLDRIYPSFNTWLAKQIIDQGGAILSEFPLETEPFKSNFPQRNRVISGLCQATLIIEANLKSGSLITASHAIEQNRDVFAIPGSIYNPNCQGTNNLIKQGAKLITSVEDILIELDLQKIKECVTTKKILPASPVQQKIFNALSQEPTYIEDLIKSVDLPLQDINSALTIMEIKGLIKNIGGGQLVTT